MVIKLKHTCQKLISSTLQITVFLIMLPSALSTAGPLKTDLDSSTRRNIQEAKMMKYGQNGNQTQNNITAPYLKNKDMDQNPRQSVEIVNTRDGRMHRGEERRCDIKVGNVIQNNRTRGVNQQNITVVEGSVINVCQ